MSDLPEKNDEPVEQPPVVRKPEVVDATPITRVLVRRQHVTPWAAATVIIVAIAGVVFLTYHVFVRVPQQMVTSGAQAVTSTVDRISEIPSQIADAFRPTINVNSVVLTSIEAVTRDPKLIVMTANVNVIVDKTASRRILWDQLDLGDATVRLRVRNNKVQYYIPVRDITRDNLEYDPETKSLCLTVPEPVLDRDFVDVQSDPAMIEGESNLVWTALIDSTDDQLMDEARTALREAVLQEGDNPMLRDQAKREAQAVIDGMLSELKAGLNDDVTFNVTFE